MTGAPEITTADIVRLPPPGFVLPGGFGFGPDGSVLTYLADLEGGLNHALLARVPGEADPLVLARSTEADSATEYSHEEQMARERRRQRATGVTSYCWAQSANRILVPVTGGLDVIDMDEPRTPHRHRVATADAGPHTDAQISADGKLVAFSKDGDIWALDVDSSKARQITFGAAAAGVRRGIAEYIAAEELDRKSGLWISPDARHIAFCEVDDSGVAEIKIGDREKHRFPFAGAANARVRVGVVTSTGGPGEPVWLDTGDDPDIYVARVGWEPGGHVCVQILSRDQRSLDLLRFDPATGARTGLLTDTSDTWINLHDLWQPLRDGSFVWASERGGFMQLELHEAEGSLIRQLTEGDWIVTSLCRVDQERRVVYVVATEAGPLERHLYRVGLDDASLERVTDTPGVHEIVMDATCSRFVDTHSSTTAPPSVTLKSVLPQHDESVLSGASDTRITTMGLAAPEIVALPASDGTTLYGAVYEPSTPRPHPTVVAVYGGPHVQLVTESWTLTANMRAQHLRQLGFCVLILDNRGSFNRGVAFESAICSRLGNIELDDQVAGVKHLVATGIADPARVGIYGWSYGGYMALIALARRPDLFRCAVAGAPVVDWRDYDTAYTERYLGTPTANSAGYEQSGVGAYLGTLAAFGDERPLLVIHGDHDENVHFSHSEKLVAALTAHDIAHEFMPLTGERHMPRDDAKRAAIEDRVEKFLRSALKP